MVQTTGQPIRDVLEMDGMAAICLLGARARQMERINRQMGSGGGGTGGRDGEWTTDSGGRKTLHIGSMETFGRVLGANW